MKLANRNNSATDRRLQYCIIKTKASINVYVCAVCVWLDLLIEINCFVFFFCGYSLLLVVEKIISTIRKRDHYRISFNRIKCEVTAPIHTKRKCNEIRIRLRCHFVLRLDRVNRQAFEIHRIANTSYRIDLHMVRLKIVLSDFLLCLCSPRRKNKNKMIEKRWTVNYCESKTVLCGTSTAKSNNNHFIAGPGQRTPNTAFIFIH